MRMVEALIALSVVSLVGVVLVQRAELRARGAELAAARDYAEEVGLMLDSARAVARAEAEAAARAEAEAVRWAALAREIQSMEGRDAPLSDHLRGAAGRLWP